MRPAMHRIAEEFNYCSVFCFNFLLKSTIQSMKMFLFGYSRQKKIPSEKIQPNRGKTSSAIYKYFERVRASQCTL